MMIDSSVIGYYVLRRRPGLGIIVVEMIISSALYSGAGEMHSCQCLLNVA
jgi:hypothetical protein